MPPKKSSNTSVSKERVDTKKSSSSKEKKTAQGEGKKEGKDKVESMSPSTSSGRKRKQTDDAAATAATATSSKAARRSARSTPRAQPSDIQVINFLLSPAALPLCRPADENSETSEASEASEASKSKSKSKAIDKTPKSTSSGKSSRLTYATGAAHFTPFQELLSAVILSRPISHRLGARTIRTIFNEPYKFTSAQAIRDAGGEKIHKALWDARTQHKAKTADQIDLVADVILERFGGQGGGDASDTLEQVREKAGSSANAQRELLQSSIKGLGKTGLNIFFRRIQWAWQESYPFVDDRTQKALTELNLPGDGHDLDRLLREHAEEIKSEDSAGSETQGEDDDMRRRKTFVILLERAISASLEGNTEEVLKNAAEV